MLSLQYPCSLWLFLDLAVLKFYRCIHVFRDLIVTFDSHCLSCNAIGSRWYCCVMTNGNASFSPQKSEVSLFDLVLKRRDVHNSQTFHAMGCLFHVQFVLTLNFENHLDSCNGRSLCCMFRHFDMYNGTHNPCHNYQVDTRAHICRKKKRTYYVLAFVIIISLQSQFGKKKEIIEWERIQEEAQTLNFREIQRWC